ncbi:uncharacterized protein LOC114720232 [Neltuma alba]|uniref:uncharacterized protein LOC114720232 n=1 Tax=Neltuma alba TaxID=207710 RepID=UPI0010A3CA52|nr:uncharacterized protein LOC114720232 [Prosopis alba]
MVVSLGPGKFYGTSLPRPRIYDDVKFNDHRVDPPVSVADPLMSWAHEAHWSMGGISFKRLRLQGKIEGNVNKLRAEREKLFKKLNRSPVAASVPVGSKGENVAGSKRASPVSPPPAPLAAKRRRFLSMIEESNEEEEESPEEEEVETVNRKVRRRLVKKLGDDFDKVALASERSSVSDSGNKKVTKGSPSESSPDRSDSMALRTRSRRMEKGGDDVDDVAMKEVEEANKSNSKGKKKAEKNTKNSQVDHSPVSGNRVRTSPRLSKRSLS